MVVTRSQSGEEERRGRVFENPPVSLSATERSTCPGRRITEASTAARQTASPTPDYESDRQSAPIARPSPVTAYGLGAYTDTAAPSFPAASVYGPSATAAPPVPAASVYKPNTTAADTAAAHPSRFTMQRSPDRSIRSGRSRTSTTSAKVRIKQAELAAMEKLAEIQRRELRLEADLVQKKLALEIAIIEDEESEAGSTHERLNQANQWLNQHESATSNQEPACTSSFQPTDLPSTAAVAAVSHLPTSQLNMPALDDAARPQLLRGERESPFYEPRVTQRDVEWENTPRQSHYQRPRSPTPTNQRSRSMGRGIEQLADAITKMARVRVPPKQVTELPIFSGAPGEWLSFKAAMRDSDLIYKFSNVENMARLRNSLRGEAREAVRALLHTSQDPEVIMKTLEQCFGRPEIIIDQALEDIKKLPRPGTSATDLNNLAVKLQNIVQTISSLDERGYLYNPMLSREVIEKLSPHLRSRWCDYAENKNYNHAEPQIITLSKFLMQEADLALKHSYAPSTIMSTRTTKATDNATAARRRDTTRKAFTYAMAADPTNKEEQQQCLYCGAHHKVPQCEKFKALKLDERWEWVKENKVCFKCINKTHRRNNCRAKPCGVDSCTRPHHSLLHSSTLATTATAVTDATPSSDGTVLTLQTGTNEQTVLLKVCPVTVIGPGGEVKTYALLDEGSSATLINAELAQKIDARGPASAINIQGINTARQEIDSRRVKVIVKTGDNANEIKAWTVEGLTLSNQTVPARLLNCEHLQDLPVENLSYDLAKPQLLIGADNWELIVTRELRTGRKSEPAASKTQLGWVIHGSAPRIIHKDEASVLHLHVRCDEGQRLHEQVNEHFKIDALGVTLTTKVSPENKRALDIFNKTVKRKNGRYEVGLIWKEDAPTMPPSYEYAYRRLKNIEKKMDRDPDFAKRYSAQIENLLSKGYAEECDGSEKEYPHQWFLPHFAVTNPNKPGKVRLVFDAAAVTHGTSLNDKLLEGPDLLQSLLGILFKFREHPVAISADIEEMFLRVKIRKEDQAAQMFLWRANERKAPPRKMKMTSMIFGASCSPFLAHSVRNHNAHAHAHTHPAALKAITESHYMDDFVNSYATEEEAAIVINEVVQVHSKAGFKLRSWNSNRAGALKNVPAELRAQSTTQLGHDNKTLGLIWNAKEDTLGFNTTMPRVPAEVRTRQRAPTKREALSAVMSVYDPLGLLSCFTISAKIYLQRLWCLQIGWDEPLPDEHAEALMNWLGNLERVTRIRLPRCYDNKQNYKKKQLHVFCDASQDAYATAIYWRLEREDGTAHVVLAAAKSKVSPIKPQSIPRLELQAAVIGARLADAVQQQHRWTADEVVYWSDSQTVLHWIRKDARRYTPFVAHRLGEIAERTDPRQWRWIPTDENVADTATRTNYVPVNAQDWWFTGPTFLKENEEHWPEELTTTEVEDIEVIHHVSTEDQQNALPKIERFSSLLRLLRATATMLLFIDKCRRQETSMTAEHLERAEKLWLAQAQKESFSDELARLRAGKPLARTSRLIKLDPEIDNEGLLRLRGRVDMAPLPTHTKRPVILDGRHPLTKLIVMQEHVNAGHAGRERVVNELRQRYWILRLRPAVRTVTRECPYCRIRKTQPNIPVCGDLPAARLDPFHRPFTNCGVDYFGPMIVTVGRRREKRWGALYTCLTTRAIHLELVNSLTTDSAIMALRRMAARRGWPKVMYSDNATNFKGADVELRAAYAEWGPALQDYGINHHMTWRYISPGAPNQGGAWERLVRSVKTALSAVLKEKNPKEEVLQTVLVEAEHSINSRPLTHVSVEPDDPEALTPNHFLLGSSQGLPYTGPCNLADRRVWRASQAIADEFWRRWLKEYLPTLVPRGGSKNEGHRSIKNGDLVIVVDPALPRNTWPRGVIERVFPGPDGEVRNAEVRTKGGTFRRPTSKLAVLTLAEAPPSLRRGEDDADS